MFFTAPWGLSVYHIVQCDLFDMVADIVQPLNVAELITFLECFVRTFFLRYLFDKLKEHFFPH